MNYIKYSLSACLYLYVGLMSSQVDFDINDLPAETLQQLSSLDPETQRELLDKYNLQLPVFPLPLENEQSSLGKNAESIQIDTEKDLMINSLVKELKDINKKDKEQNKIERFGLSFFSQEISTFAPVDDISVPDDYILGVGDSLVIQTMGSSFDRYDLQVQRDGNIVIENLGMVTVTGLSINQASSMIKRMFSQQLFGLEVSVNLGKLRAMNIFMAGEVNNPGMYSLSSLTTITQALYQSGGITELGSLRNIKVRRNGKDITTFDAYDLLVYGDSSSDIRLRSGDVVLVPSYEKLVTVQGESKRPMIYELLPRETVSDLLQISSGFSQQATPLNAVLISKKALGLAPEIKTLNLLVRESLDTILGVDDTLIIQKANQKPDNYIELIGALYRTGPIGWIKGMRLSDLFTTIDDDFPDYIDTEFSLISRKSQNTKYRNYLSFSLNDLFNGDTGNDIEIMEFDKIYFFSTSFEDIDIDIEEKDRLESLEEYTAVPQEKNNEIDNSFQANLKNTGIFSVEGFKFTRKKLLEDEIRLAKLNTTSENPSTLISITGAIKYPGTYPLFEGANISALLKAAGGPLDSAYLKSAELRRQSYTNFTYDTELVEIDLSNGSTNADKTLLKSLDHLNVRTISDWNQEKVITVTGEVKFPGDYRVSANDNLITIIERAGGFKDSAFVNGSVFLKESIRRLEVDNLNSYANSLKQIFSASSLTQENIGMDAVELENILSLLNSIEPSGRVSINWDNEEDLETMIIENGDTLFVPQKTNHVQVLGEVNVPNIVNFSKDLSVEDYIQLAGGLTKRADNTVYVVKANGSSIVLEKKFFRPFAEKLRIEPGDSIVAPVNIQYTDTLSNWTQITQVIYQSMVSIAAVNGL